MRMRVTLAFLLILGPFLLASSHLVINLSRNSSGTEAKLLIEKVIQGARSYLDHPNWKERLTTFVSSPNVQSRGMGAIVVDRHGDRLWSSAKNAPGWPNPPEFSTARLPSEKGVLYVSFGDFAEDHASRLRDLLTLSSIALVALCLGAWLLVGKTLSPIRALARQAATASADHPDVQLVSPSQDSEMRELVSTLNGFLGRIQEASDEKTRFYAAASHELRTPLQALSGQLEVALSQPRSAEDYHVALKEAHGQTQRLTSLVESVLLLHQLQGPRAAAVETVCLAAEIEETLESLSPLLEAKKAKLARHLDSGLKVQAVTMHMHVLIRNLLENAAKYCGDGGAVSIDLQFEGGAPRLMIKNDCAHDIDVTRLFEPFYRLDASRSTKSGGNGLGLAICQAVVKANGWSISLSREGEWIVASVRFVS
jgi:signal transduction histidine kinase